MKLLTEWIYVRVLNSFLVISDLAEKIIINYNNVFFSFYSCNARLTNGRSEKSVFVIPALRQFMKTALMFFFSVRYVLFFFHSWERKNIYIF